jgi:anthranilate phosphoribosyltransferase
MFAPVFHPSMRFAAAPRREIAIRTVFNILGPLTNPAHPQFQVLGVSDPRLLENMARALSRLGATHALVVHGHDGLDELSISGPTDVCELRDGWTTRYQILPDDVGLSLAPIESVLGGDAEENAGLLRSVLDGATGPRRDIVLFNAGAALYAAGKAQDVRDGIGIAAKSIDTGAARSCLDRLVEVTNAFDELDSVDTPESAMYPTRFLWDVD